MGKGIVEKMNLREIFERVYVSLKSTTTSNKSIIKRVQLMCSCCAVVQGIIAACGETGIPLTVTPMTIGPMHEWLQITIAGVEDMILVKI